MPLLALLALFIVVPLAELYVILKVGDAIGVLPTIALLAIDSVLGSLLLRAQGRSVWRRFNETMASPTFRITYSSASGTTMNSATSASSGIAI